MLASGAPVSDSLVSGKLEDDSDDWGSSRIGGVVLSYSIFLFLSALFLLQVASISKSNGTKSPVEDLPRIQSTSMSSGKPIQEKNKFWTNYSHKN